jgi:hypothetical protein
LSESGLRPSPRATAPVHNTLFFAGQAVGVKDKPGNVASVHVIESGIQAARDLIASLRN